jgi:hypothetical protein
MQWIPTVEQMPETGRVVLACYENHLGNVRRIRAAWVAAKTAESGWESKIGEYDEASDCYYDPEGWYEQIDNCPDYSAVAVHQGEITHWMPLPDPPVARHKPKKDWAL